MENFGVCIITKNSNGEILIGKRKNGYKEGYYGMPGGRVELHESLIDACKRELHEETGLEIDDFRFVGVVREFQDGYTFIHFGFVAEYVLVQPTNTEPDKCEEWEWHDMKNLPDKILVGHKSVIEMYKNKEHITDITGIN